MKFHHFAAAVVLGLVAAPQVALAQAARITPVLSSTMQRTCQSETSAVLLMERGQAIAGAAPSIERQTRGLRASRTPDGWLFLQTAAGPQGDTLLEFETAPGGAVTRAALSGSAVDAYAAATPGADMPAYARAVADDVPERLLLGRTFAVGDSYYPDELKRSLVSRVISSMGLPFPVSGAIDVRYEGEESFAGRRAWRFAGRITAGGSGQVEGVDAAIDQVSEVALLHDADTGLVLQYETVSNTRVDVNGQPFRHLRMIDAYTCEIVPQ